MDGKQLLNPLTNNIRTGLPSKAKEGNMKRKFNTVMCHYNSTSALNDAKNRSNKRIWLYIPDRIFAIGDCEDLPYKWREGDWGEISLSDLQIIEKGDKELKT